jgi:hypothetical protein
LGILELDAADRRTNALLHELGQAITGGSDKEQIQPLLRQILLEAHRHFELEAHVLMESACPLPKGHAVLHSQMRAELDGARGGRIAKRRRACIVGRIRASGHATVCRARTGGRSEEQGISALQFTFRFAGDLKRYFAATGAEAPKRAVPAKNTCHGARLRMETAPPSC